jgi:hypothetical protein
MSMGAAYAILAVGAAVAATREDRETAVASIAAACAVAWACCAAPSADGRALVSRLTPGAAALQAVRALPKHDLAVEHLEGSVRSYARCLTAPSRRLAQLHVSDYNRLRTMVYRDVGDTGVPGLRRVRDDAGRDATDFAVAALRTLYAHTDAVLVHKGLQGRPEPAPVEAASENRSASFSTP